MSNPAFTKHIKHLRGWMPIMGIVGVVITYIFSALLGGFLLSFVIKGGALALILAYGVPVAIQFCRGIVAFFGQLNPDTPDYGYTREAIVIFLGLVSIVEVISLGHLAGWPFPVIGTISILMAIGSIIELMLLSEIKRHNRAEIMNDPAALQRIEQSAIKEAQYMKFQEDLSAIKRGEGTASSLQLTTNQEHAEIKQLKETSGKLGRENSALLSAQAEAERQRKEDIAAEKRHAANVIEAQQLKTKRVEAAAAAALMEKEERLKEQERKIKEQSDLIEEYSQRAITREKATAPPTPPTPTAPAKTDPIVKTRTGPAEETEAQRKARTDKYKPSFEIIENGKRTGAEADF